MQYCLSSSMEVICTPATFCCFMFLFLCCMAYSDATPDTSKIRPNTRQYRCIMQYSYVFDVYCLPYYACIKHVFTSYYDMYRMHAYWHVLCMYYACILSIFYSYSTTLSCMYRLRIMLVLCLYYACILLVSRPYPDMEIPWSPWKAWIRS